VAAWKKIASDDLASYGIPPTKLTDAVCGAGAPTTPAEKKRRGDAKR
jgi:hypothetical protein